MSTPRATPSVKLLLVVFAALLVVIVIWVSLQSSATLPRVCITQIATHPSLDEVRKGIIEALESRGFVDGEQIELIFRNANGDPSLSLPIAQDFVRQNAAVIVPITTPSALGAAKSTDRIPIVFGGVTDPVGVGLVSNLDHPGGNITGTSDRWPYKQQIEFFVKLLPDIRRVGMLYTSGDDVAALALEEIRKNAALHGLELVTQPVSNPSDVYVSATSMLRNVDAIYTGMDNLIAENLESVLKAARESGKPVLAGDAQSVARGALATWSISMYDLGRITGDMVADVLEGEAPATMPVRVVTEGHPVVNRKQFNAFPIDREYLNGLQTEFVDGGG